MQSFIQTIQTALATLVLTLSFTAISTGVVYAQNQSAESACDSLSVIDGQGSCSQKTDDVSVNSGLETIFTLISFVAGVVAVLMIMLAGLRYITSQGDSQKVSQAKNAIIYAAIGIVVVALAQLIVRFVLGFFA